jgi:hypothetical protein
MTNETSFIFRMKEYRGCGIQPASYKVGPRDWVPEACFWLHTENGWRRLWINSFTHCLAAHDLTFPNKIEADACAFSLARTLIDRTLPEFDVPESLTRRSRTNYLSKILKVARRPFTAYTTFREYKYRN